MGVRGAELSGDRLLYWSYCQKCSGQFTTQRKGDPIPARLPPCRADQLFPGLGRVQLGLELYLPGVEGARWGPSWKVPPRGKAGPRKHES